MASPINEQNANRDSSFNHQKSGANLESNPLLERVGNSASQSWSHIKQAVCFPLRYLGSKTWSVPGLIAKAPILLLEKTCSTNSAHPHAPLFSSGYHYQPQPASLEISQKYLSDAYIAAAVYDCDCSHFDRLGLTLLNPQELNINLSQLPGNIEANDKRFVDLTTGFKMMIVEYANEIIMAFGALASAPRELADVPEDEIALRNKLWVSVVIAELAGLTPILYEQAEAMFLEIQKHERISVKQIRLVGHSMGASQASFIGLRNQIKASCFNSLALGPSLQKAIGADRLRAADQYITHLSVHGDFFSDPPCMTLLDRFIGLVGLRTPGNFGNHFRIPSTLQSQSEIHNNFVGAIEKHLIDLERKK